MRMQVFDDEDDYEFFLSLLKTGLKIELHAYCLIALLPYCLIALLPYCLIALLPYCLIA
ncbi:hypothetical protein [Abyssogena phaseoliformis symbiont]|uniref:hypothetical protein n=1 Tax=Abyssogena phaseoliformis symbiont TaxID=596095 RepID=UPI0019152165|nr:hypothetical protein [Abyssogena phaseoliformis symbiont]